MIIKLKKLWLIAFLVYIIIILFLTVVNRVPNASNTVKLDLFWGYKRINIYVIIDNILNIASFVPIGLMSGVVFRRQRIIKALLIGLLVSIVIEGSQFMWHRGVFDVDDLFNNTVGALIGGMIVALMVKVRDLRKG